METDALVKAYGLLHTSGARQRALKALMRELSPHEWRTVQRIAAARSFQFDIVGRLPVELVAQVFAYLDISTPYLLQPVSRQWCHVLRSPDVLQKGLLSWYHTLDQISADYKLLELKAKEIHAYRHGKPKHWFKIIGTLRKPNRIILRADTLMWGDNRVVRLFHIRTWTMHTLNGDARESIRQLFASDQIVGFTTASNVCYVSNFQGSGKRKFRVPNPALFQSLACRQRTVACAGTFEDHVLVYMWSYDSQQGRSLIIPFDAFPVSYAPSLFTHKQGVALLLHPEDARITVFAGGLFVADESQRHGGTIWYSQFTYAGDQVYESEITLHNDHESCTTFFEDLNNPFVPVDGLGLLRVSVGSEQLPLMNSRWLQFDERLNKFTEPRPAVDKGQMWADHTIVWWKDTFFSSSRRFHDRLPAGSASALTHLGTSEKPQFESLMFDRVDWLRSPGDISDPDAVLLSDKYIVRVLEECFHILCYEENAHYPKKNVDFFGVGHVELLWGNSH